MSPRRSGRSVTCTAAECRTRRDQARMFLQVAEVVLTEDRREAHVAAALRDTTLPTKLRRLLADKDAAHYSPNFITVDRAKSVVRQATALLAEADAW